MIKNKHRYSQLVVLFSIVCFTQWGCLNQAKMSEPSYEPRAALHVVCCNKLDSVMKNIDKTYRRAHRLPIRLIRKRNFAILEDSMKQVAEHAQMILVSADLKGVPHEDKFIFERLADKLESKALLTAKAAAAQDHYKTRLLLSELSSTCTSCHAAFRGPYHNNHKGGS